MEQEFSKYDLLDKNMLKLSKVIRPFLLSTISDVPKHKYKLIEKYIDNLMVQGNIVFELRKDINKYYNEHDKEFFCMKHLMMFDKFLEFEKILVIFTIFNTKGYKLIDLIINNLEGKMNEGDIYFLLDEEDKSVLKMLEDNYSFNKLPKKYQDMVNEVQTNYMNRYILPYVSKEDTLEVEFLKREKMIAKNWDVNYNLNIGVSKKLIK